jgi:hypothetical protein
MFLRYQNNRFFSLRSALCALLFPCVLVPLCLCILLSGCSTVKKVQHLPQLLTLKDYSDSQERLSEEVGKSDNLFNEMVEEIESGNFAYQTSRQIERRFGEPVFKREREYQGRTCEQWLYRHAKDFSGDKVYVYFDDGQLINVEHDKK